MSRVEHFGEAWIPGTENFGLSLEPNDRLHMLGELDACPNPEKVAEQFGLAWTIARYAECNFVGAYILDRARELNLGLYTALTTSRPRLSQESPVGFDPRVVPTDYTATLYAGSKLARYAAPRVAIEQFGRNPQWQIGDTKVSVGQQIIRETISQSGDPIDFIVRLSRRVVEADANPTAVLSHTLAAEHLDEGILLEIRETAQRLEQNAPDLWRHYLSLTPQERKKAGILPLEILMGTIDINHIC